MKKLIFSLMMVVGLSSFIAPGILPKIKKGENQSVIVVASEKVIVSIQDEDNHILIKQTVDKPTKFNLTNLEDGKYKMTIQTLNSTVIEERELILKTETKRSLN